MQASREEPWHRFLGNVTYTEVVVSSAGLAALSKRTVTLLSEDVAAVERTLS